MGVNSLPKTVTQPRCGCDLNPGPSAPESSTLTTRLPSHPVQGAGKTTYAPRGIYKSGAKAQVFFPHHESAKSYYVSTTAVVRDPQQRFTKPQSGLYTIRAMYSISQHQQSAVGTPVTAGVTGQCENAGLV